MTVQSANPAAQTTQASVELDERRLGVVAEQASGLRWQILLTAFIVAAIAWQGAPKPLVVAWFAVVIASREARAAGLFRMQRSSDIPIALRLRRTVTWNALIGAANGSAALFMLWLDASMDAVLTMILVSWGAGAVSTSATVMPAFIVYASLLFVPTAAMWVASGTWLGSGIAVLVVMFFGVQIRFAKRNLQTFEESFGIRQENVALAQSLAIERGELALARDAAVRANLEKSQFLAAASHDLRQPLQAMALNSGELTRLQLDDDARAIACEIAASVEQVRTMLDALLDVSKLDAGVVVPQPKNFSLDRLLDGMAGSFRAGAAARGLALRCQCEKGIAVYTDPDLLRRTLANLIDNAIKFTSSGGVYIDVASDGAWVELTVRDTGRGIASEDQGRVFEDLVQLDNPERDRAKGHGLGLGIVRRLAALLNVDITLESALGTGTTFRLRVPAAAAEPVLLPAPDASDWNLIGVRVLVLDDDSMVRGAYVNALAGLGCVVSGASCIADAVAQAQVHRPHAAVIDCRLRDREDGFSGLQQLRLALPTLAAVMVTADTDRTIVATARRHGIQLLRKPVDVPTLGRALFAAMNAQAP